MNKNPYDAMFEFFKENAWNKWLNGKGKGIRVLLVLEDKTLEWFMEGNEKKSLDWIGQREKVRKVFEKFWK